MKTPPSPGVFRAQARFLSGSENFKASDRWYKAFLKSYPQIVGNIRREKYTTRRALAKTEENILQHFEAAGAAMKMFCKLNQKPHRPDQIANFTY